MNRWLGTAVCTVLIITLMAFHRSSAILRKVIRGGCSSRTAAVSSYSPSLSNSFSYSNSIRSHSTESDNKGVTSSAAGYHINNESSYMRGAVFWEPNKPLTFEDFHMPRPKVNEVLIKTKGIVLIRIWFVVIWSCDLL